MSKTSVGLQLYESLMLQMKNNPGTSLSLFRNKSDGMQICIQI